MSVKCQVIFLWSPGLFFTHNWDKHKFLLFTFQRERENYIQPKNSFLPLPHVSMLWAWPGWRRRKGRKQLGSFLIVAQNCWFFFQVKETQTIINFLLSSIITLKKDQGNKTYSAYLYSKGNVELSGNLTYSSLVLDQQWVWLVKLGSKLKFRFVYKCNVYQDLSEWFGPLPISPDCSNPRALVHVKLIWSCEKFWSYSEFKSCLNTRL